MLLYAIDKKFNTANELLQHLLNDDDYSVSRATEALVPGKCGFVFRGHADESWPLLPVVHRSGEPHALWAYTPQPPVYRTPTTEDERRFFLGDHVFEELAAVKRFLETADKLGLPTPIDYQLFEIHRQEVRRLWNEKDDTYKNAFPDPRLLPSIALAQHNGVPTRLLDWSESGLVAAFFAASGAWLLSKRGQVKEERCAIIRLNTGGKEDVIQLVKAPRHANSFLRAQQGCFTLIPQANAHFFKDGEWPSVRDVMPAGLARLSMPVSEAKELLRLLLRFDVTRHHLMPTLENAAQAMPYLKELLK